MSLASPDPKARHQAYYNALWTDHEVVPDSGEMRRLAVILEAFAEVMDHLADAGQRPRICDFGCGRGWLSAEFARFGDVTGVDLSPEAVRLAAQRWPNVRFIAADLTQWRPGETFDLAVSSEVIEHVMDKAAFMATLKEVVRPGGYVIMTTPTGMAKAAYTELGFEMQPVEDWLSCKEFQALFARDFKILMHKTFQFDFSHSGIYRLSNSEKLRRIFKGVGMRHLYEGLLRNCDLGLTQILIARRPAAG